MLNIKANTLITNIHLIFYVALSKADLINSDPALKIISMKNNYSWARYMLKTLTWHLAESRSIKGVNKLSIGFKKHLWGCCQIFELLLCTGIAVVIHFVARFVLFNISDSKQTQIISFWTRISSPRHRSLSMVRCSETKELTLMHRFQMQEPNVTQRCCYQRHPHLRLSD